MGDGHGLGIPVLLGYVKAPRNRGSTISSSSPGMAARVIVDRFCYLLASVFLSVKWGL